MFLEYVIQMLLVTNFNVKIFEFKLNLDLPATQTTIHCILQYTRVSSYHTPGPLFIFANYFYGHVL